jgi:hypothetical protein
MADEVAQIRVVGARTLVKAMREAGTDLDDLKAANMAVGAVVLAAANPPRRTGRLAASGRVARARSKASVTYSRVYAGPIHWGWPRRGIPANPWLSQAAQRTEGTWTEVYLRAINQIVDDIQGQGAP